MRKQCTEKTSENSGWGRQGPKCGDLKFGQLLSQLLILGLRKRIHRGSFPVSPFSSRFDSLPNFFLSLEMNFPCRFCPRCQVCQVFTFEWPHLTRPLSTQHTLLFLMCFEVMSWFWVDPKGFCLWKFCLCLQRLWTGRRSCRQHAAGVNHLTSVGPFSDSFNNAISANEKENFGQVQRIKSASTKP